MHTREDQRGRKILPIRNFNRRAALALLVLLPLLSACSAAGTSSIPVAQLSSPTAAPQTGASSSDYVVDWVIWGTPTQTPTVNPTTAALWATIIAGTPTAAPTTAGTKAPASSSGSTSSATKVALVIPTSGPGADASRGEQLFHGGAGCMACHDTTSGATIVGPSLKGIAERAGSREPGKSADYYLHESIMAPNAYVVSGFPANTMPQNFAQTLSSQQIDDLVAYLKSLK